MLDAVVHENVSCGSESTFHLLGGEGATPSVLKMPMQCFACGGVLSIRTGDFCRCTTCQAENYCPLTDVSVEERARRWFHRRGCV